MLRTGLVAALLGFLWMYLPDTASTDPEQVSRSLHGGLVTAGIFFAPFGFLAWIFHAPRRHS
jgi:hypothetical protein